MGAAPAAIEIGIMIAGTAAKTISEQQAAEAKESALRKQITQERIATSQKVTLEDQKAKRVLAQQNLMAGASGVTAGSFSPIEEKTFDSYAQDRNATMLQGEWEENSMQEQADNLEDAQGLFAFGNLADAAQKVYNIKTTDSRYGYAANTDDRMRSILDPTHYNQKDKESSAGGIV